ncbi:MAG: hypothetical protein EOL86_07080 [Deltaproteobacteria bacterium]|nr:hypothetical protein [Deltaproteobacteria bacterium]
MAVLAQTFWDDGQKFHYLPRLRNRQVLEKAVQAGAASQDFFGCAYGQKEDGFEGFQFGSGNVQVDGTLLLIEPGAAKAYEEKLAEEARREREKYKPVDPVEPTPVNEKPPVIPIIPPAINVASPVDPPKPQANAFHGCAEISAGSAKARLTELAEEIIAVLAQDPNAEIRVNLEIHAEYPDGVSDQIKRALTENSRMLGLKMAEWE